MSPWDGLSPQTCARAFALGGLALAAQANSAPAAHFVSRHWFFQAAQAVVGQMAWLQLLWLLPMLVFWRRVRAGRGNPDHDAAEDGGSP